MNVSDINNISRSGAETNNIMSGNIIPKIIRNKMIHFINKGYTKKALQLLQSNGVTDCNIPSNRAKLQSKFSEGEPVDKLIGNK